MVGCKAEGKNGIIISREMIEERERVGRRKGMREKAESTKERRKWLYT